MDKATKYLKEKGIEYLSGLKILDIKKTISELLEDYHQEQLNELWLGRPCQNVESIGKPCTKDGCEGRVELLPVCCRCGKDH